MWALPILITHNRVAIAIAISQWRSRKTLEILQPQKRTRFTAFSRFAGRLNDLLVTGSYLHASPLKLNRKRSQNLPQWSIITNFKWKRPHCLFLFHKNRNIAQISPYLATNLIDLPYSFGCEPITRCRRSPLWWGGRLVTAERRWPVAACNRWSVIGAGGVTVTAAPAPATRHLLMSTSGFEYSATTQRPWSMPSVITRTHAHTYTHTHTNIPPQAAVYVPNSITAWQLADLIVRAHIFMLIIYNI